MPCLRTDVKCVTVEHGAGQGSGSVLETQDIDIIVWNEDVDVFKHTLPQREKMAFSDKMLIFAEKKVMHDGIVTAPDSCNVDKEASRGINPAGVDGVDQIIESRIQIV